LVAEAFVLVMPAFVFVLRLVVGGVLLSAGIVKVRAGPQRFLRAVVGYELLPARVAGVVAFLVPWSEITLGIALLLGAALAVAAPLAAVLLVIFSSAISVSLLRGRANSCGCGAGSMPVRWSLLVRNLALVACLIPLSASDRTSTALTATAAIAVLVLAVAVRTAYAASGQRAQAT
jgi:uncharacterized membrane protein YphA (DoxX/SURF4 family)